MSISQLTLTFSDEEPAYRFEVFTGSGRRREWSDERKPQIVAESYVPRRTSTAFRCLRRQSWMCRRSLR